MGLYGWPAGPHRTGLPAPADEASGFRCPVLAIYGGADQGIPPEAIEAFDHAMDAAGVEHRTVVYENAPHSFFDRKATEFADASAGAWSEMLGFMQVPLGGADDDARRDERVEAPSGSGRRLLRRRRPRRRWLDRSQVQRQHHRQVAEPGDEGAHSGVLE